MKKFILLTYSLGLLLTASAQWPGKGHGHHHGKDSAWHHIDSVKLHSHGWWDSVWHANHPKDTLHHPKPDTTGADTGHHKPHPKPGKGWHGHPIPKDSAWHHHGPPPFDTAWHHPWDTSKPKPPHDSTGHHPKDTTNHPWPPKDTSDHHGPPPPPDTSNVDTPGHHHGKPKMKSMNTLQVSPNPARQVIYMDAFNATEAVKTEIYDLTGRFMGYFILENKSLNISTLGRGQYVVRFTDSEGVLQTGRFTIIE